MTSIAGGLLVPGSRSCWPFALSGASSGLLPAKVPLAAPGAEVAGQVAADGNKEIDVRSIASGSTLTRKLGIMLGGGIVIYGNGADVLKEALACSRFFREQSCG